MPTSPLSAANLLDALGARATPPSGADTKDNFQSLLDIGSPGDSDTGRKNLPLRRKEESENPVAAALDIPAPPVATEKPRVVELREDAPPARSEAKSEEPAAERSESPHSEKWDARTVSKAERSTTKEVSPSEDNAGATEAGTASAITATSAVKNPAVTAASANDNASSRDQLASVLGDQIAFLSKLLEILQALGGNPQQALAKSETMLVQLTELKVTVSSFSITGGNLLFQAAPGGGLLGSPGEALKNIQDMLAQLQNLADTGSETQGPNAIRALFSGLKKEVQDFLQALTQQPALAEEALPEADALANQMADLISASKQLLAKLNSNSSQNNTLTVDTSASLPEVVQATKENTPPVFKQTAQDAGLQNNVPVAQTPASLVIANQASLTGALSGDDAATGGNSSGFNNSQGGGQPLPQAVGTARENGPSQGAGGVASTNFSRLLAQASERPVIEQVAFHIKTAIADGSSKIDIRLNPAELGKLEIKLHVAADGKTGVIVTADSRQTLDLLQRDSRGLEQALSDAGLKADSGSLSFNLRGGQHEQGQGNLASQSYQKTMPEEEQPSVVSVSGYYTVEAADGLDIRI